MWGHLGLCEAAFVCAAPGVLWSTGCAGCRGAGGGRPGASLPCRYLVVFNPLEQERLSVVPVLVDTPHVRVLSEEGQPLPAQLTAQWGSTTNVVPDVYQVWVPPCPCRPCPHRASLLPSHANTPPNECFRTTAGAPTARKTPGSHAHPPPQRPQKQGPCAAGSQ